MNKKKEAANYTFRNLGHQFYAAIVANIIMFAHGCVVGWVSPALLLLMDQSTPLSHGPLTLEQASWIGSCASIGALFGSFTFGYITSFLGCKRAMTFLTIPALVFWLLIMFGDSFTFIVTARFISGWAGGGILSTVVLFTAEIANDEIRGALATVTQLARNSGILVSYIVAAKLNYNEIPYIFIGIPIIYLVLFSLLPNTPFYLIRRNKLEKAENSLKFYKGCKGKTVSEVSALSMEFDRLKFLINHQSKNKTLQWSDIFERKALKGLCIGTVLSCVNQMSGCFTLLTYAATIFSKTESHLDPFTSAIALAIAQILGNLLTTLLADKYGRKILIAVSLAGCSLSLFSLSIYLYLIDAGFDMHAFDWMPVCLLSFSIFIGSAGIIPLTSVCTVEVLPPKIRTFGVTFTTITINIFAFTATKSFPLLMEKINLYGCFTIHGLFCVGGILFVIFVMDETKGKNIDDIERKQKKSIVEMTNIS